MCLPTPQRPCLARQAVETSCSILDIGAVGEMLFSGTLVSGNLRGEEREQWLCLAKMAEQAHSRMKLCKTVGTRWCLSHMLVPNHETVHTQGRQKRVQVGSKAQCSPSCMVVQGSRII